MIDDALRMVDELRSRGLRLVEFRLAVGDAELSLAAVELKPEPPASDAEVKPIRAARPRP